LTFTLVACSDETPPVHVSDNLRILDDNEAIYGITVQGTAMQIHYLGTFAELDIAPGNIIVGSDGDGFLREVLAVTPDDANEMATLETRYASLAEVIEDGSFHETVTTSSGARAGTTLVDLTGKVLVNETGPNGSLNITLTNGTVNFAPDFNFDADVGFFTLKRFEATAQGTLSANFDVSIMASAGYQSEGNVDLGGDGPAYTKDFSFHIGPLPVKGRIEMDFRGGYEVNTEAAGTLTTGFDASASLEAGAKYENENWDWIWNTNFDANAHPTNWSYSARGSAKVYVAPVIRTYFYGMAGPKLDLSKHWDGDFDYMGQGKPQQVDVNVEQPGVAVAPPQYALCAGAGGKVDYTLKVFSFELAKFEASLPDQFQELESAGGATCAQSGPNSNNLDGSNNGNACAEQGAGWMSCPMGGGYCIHESFFCDGISDCPNNEDEANDAQGNPCPQR